MLSNLDLNVWIIVGVQQGQQQVCYQQACQLVAYVQQVCQFTFKGLHCDSVDKRNETKTDEQLHLDPAESQNKHREEEQHETADIYQ